MPNPVGLNNNSFHIGNNYPNVGNVNNVGNAGNVGTLGINVAPELDAAGKANAIYKASVVATEIDVLITKAAASSVGSLDGAALEKAIADAKVGKSTRKELQAMIGRLVGETRTAMESLSLYTGEQIARRVRSAKNFANTQVDNAVKSGQIAASACKALGIAKLGDPPTLEQADAVEEEKRKVFDEKFHQEFKKTSVGKALANALKAQNELSDRLADLINGYVSDTSLRLEASDGKETAFSRQVAEFHKKMNKLGDRAAGNILAVLEEAKFQCDRRVCELETLELTLGDLVEATAGDAQIDASLRQGSVTSLISDSASRMHGNDTVLKSLDAKINGIAEKIKGLGADTAGVGQEKLNALAGDVRNLQQELAKTAETGYIEIDVTDEAASGLQQKKKAKVYVDRTFIDQASKQIDEAAGKLKDFAANMRRETLTTMLDKAFNLHRFCIFDEKYLTLLKSDSPKTYKLCRTIVDFEKACKAFIAAPSEKTERALHKIANTISRDWLNNNCDAVERELHRVYHKLADKGNGRTPLEKELSTMLRLQFSNLTASREAFEPVEDFEKYLFRHVASLDKAATLLATESKKFTSADKTGMLVSGAVRNVFEGKMTLTTLVNARINGLSDNDVDTSFDDRNVRSQDNLGSGALNTVTLVSYNDNTERVFKPDAAGRIPLTNTPLVSEMDITVSIAKLNLATMKTAKAFGLDDVVVKTTVGVHDGQSGIFMEKAPGISGKKFAGSLAPSSADSAEYSLGDIMKMMKAPVGTEERSKGERISAELMRKTTRLEWLDIICGQGDRHRDNFFVHVGKDGTVDVKGIDNDSCFSTHRTGLTTFVMKGVRNYQLFKDTLRQKCDEVFGDDPVASNDVFEKLMKDPGLTVNRKGGTERAEKNADALFDMEEDEDKDVESFAVDFSKISDPILIASLKSVLAVNALHVPDCIDEDTYNHLMAMDGDTQARRDYLADVKASLGEGDAYNNAISRLNDAIKHAKKLQEQGKVYGKDKWIDVVQGTTDVNSQVRSELSTKKSFKVNTRNAAKTNGRAINAIKASVTQLMSSFYARLTA